jgi:hypothetical protein
MCAQASQEDLELDEYRDQFLQEQEEDEMFALEQFLQDKWIRK